MHDDLGLTPTAIRRLIALLNHPDHQRDLEERHLEIKSVSPLTESLVRVTAQVSGTDPLDAWSLPNTTLHLEFPAQSAAMPGQPTGAASASRVYTVRDIDLDSRMLTIDFVRHPEPSPTMQWLASVAPGNTVRALGPRPHRLPHPGSPRILLADAAALPSALSVIRRMPFDTETTVFIAASTAEVELFQSDAADAIEAGLRIHTVDPNTPMPLYSAFRSRHVPLHTSVWAAGECKDMRALDQHCRTVLRLPTERAQTINYWKADVTSDRIDLARLQATQQAVAAGARH
ncbi:MAG: siderophore-interacting protein [Gulosibacter sp.]|uniref:siderophore-interacting protein n=1 Tax=Gulosibacter sp. TaxID=2817531 RepID=UPI003F92F014